MTDRDKYVFEKFCKLPVSTTAVLATAVGLGSSVATDPVPSLLVSQSSSSNLGSGGNEDQVISLPTKRSSRECQDTDEILNFLKVGNEQTKKTYEQIESTLSACTLDVKKSWHLRDGGQHEGDQPVFVECY